MKWINYASVKKTHIKPRQWTEQTSAWETFTIKTRANWFIWYSNIDKVEIIHVLGKKL